MRAYRSKRPLIPQASLPKTRRRVKQPSFRLSLSTSSRSSSPHYLYIKLDMSKQETRRNYLHGPKRQTLGNQAGRAPPAWKANQKKATGQNALEGKILLSNLPKDVTLDEVKVGTHSPAW